MCIEFGDIPITPYHIQLKHPSHSDTIGRDKPMDRPRSARYEELHHIHFWQEGCVWEDDDGYQVQWNSTSDAFIIYYYLFLFYRQRWRPSFLYNRPAP
ncbi:type II toxin-antitoxin system YafO family toxin [Arsenophonus sp.]|nr:type II toxin-antitoxin system YafO family toxin [Arsenophonus sp.]MDR5609937.1 type II toxin-antitoxin system YafO family toxin [Arsenophonus sp.]MDR5614914.1 type II toxin-antitoxin system YafO family toxin [Arsenophonus sp.]